MRIDGTRFARTGSDVWESECGRLKLMLMMGTETAAYPWRVEVDGIQWRAKFSTPVVAIVRTKERIGYDDTRRPAAVADSPQAGA
jgi:hypothetical protein